MSNTLAWIAAIGASAAAIGTWLGPARARWLLRAERLRTGAARRENELHRQRFTEVWHYWHDLPERPERSAAIGWYNEWTGARDPFSGEQDGPQAPGTHAADIDDAYERYLGFLEAHYHPGKLSPPRRISFRPGKAGKTGTS